MDSYLNLLRPSIETTSRRREAPIFDGKVIAPATEYRNDGKSYAANWEIYSQIPHFNINEWLHDDKNKV